MAETRAAKDDSEKLAWTIFLITAVGAATFVGLVLMFVL